jgi:hypothetical protein
MTVRDYATLPEDAADQIADVSRANLQIILRRASFSPICTAGRGEHVLEAIKIRYRPAGSWVFRRRSKEIEAEQIGDAVGTINSGAH